MFGSIGLIFYHFESLLLFQKTPMAFPALQKTHKYTVLQKVLNHEKKCHASLAIYTLKHLVESSHKIFLALTVSQ